MIKSIIIALSAFTAISANANANGLYPVTAPMNAEIQVFIDYRGFNDYRYKFVSTPDRLISAGYLYPSSSPIQNGACFMGDVYDAQELFQQMVWLMNEKNKSYTEPIVTVEYEKSTFKPYLKIDGFDVNGRRFEWFPRLSPCLRWSTPEERALEPIF